MEGEGRWVLPRGWMSALCLLGPRGGQKPCHLAHLSSPSRGFRDLKRQCLLKLRDPDFPQGPVWEGGGKGGK